MTREKMLRIVLLLEDLKFRKDVVVDINNDQGEDEGASKR